MEVKINIDESKFQEVLEKELGAFSKEELHIILTEAFKEYLGKEEVLKEFLNRCDYDRWGSPVRGTSTMDKLIQHVDLNDVFAEPKEKIKEIILEDSTLKALAVDLLAGIFKTRFRDAFLNDYSFMDMLANRVAMALDQKKQNNPNM
jgi:hypothetical protein